MRKNSFIYNSFRNFITPIRLMHTPMNNVEILTHESLAYGNYKPRV